jgi:hypothetical protein
MMSSHFHIKTITHDLKGERASESAHTARSTSRGWLSAMSRENDGAVIPSERASEAKLEGRVGAPDSGWRRRWDRSRPVYGERT